MLTVRDIAHLPDLQLSVAAGAGGLDNEVTWLHGSELSDPTRFLEGGELLLTTGLGVGETASSQRSYVRRLADHGVSGLGFGVGFGFAEVPPAIAAEAERRSFPILSVPYEVPFVAITRAAFTHLANEQLERLTSALEVHERLAEAVLESRGLHALLAILCSHLRCSLALVDERGRVVAERHARGRLRFDDALELPVVAGGERATLKAVRASGEFGEYDRLVLHHGQTAVAFDLARRRAVSAAELRLAGDLLDDLERGQLDEREAGRRLSAFGLDPEGRYAAVVALPGDGQTGESLRRSLAAELTRRGIAHLSTARRERAAFLVAAEREEDGLHLARAAAEAEPHARLGVGRPAHGVALGRSLLEARAALEAGAGAVSSYRDLGSLELLLGLPDASLAAFVDRVLGPAASNERLVGSLEALLDSGCRWSEAAARLGVHRLTLRYRMNRLRELTGRHPDEPDEQMELWLAVRAVKALTAKGATATAP